MTVCGFIDFKLERRYSAFRFFLNVSATIEQGQTYDFHNFMASIGVITKI